jgi:LPS-assembly lipoprotein
LSSCGWQLRGYEPGKSYAASDINELKIVSASRNNAFFRRLGSALKRNKIEDVPSSEYVLEIVRETIDRKPLTYNRIGTPSQYKIAVSIDYQFSHKDKTVLPLQKITSRRNYDFDPNLIIAKDKEQEALIQEMRDELSQRIIDSINSRR